MHRSLKLVLLLLALSLVLVGAAAGSGKVKVHKVTSVCGWIEKGGDRATFNDFSISKKHPHDKYFCLVGKNGARGALGTPGPRGETGAAGQTGAKGETGSTGSAGAQGEVGPAGAVGGRREPRAMSVLPVLLGRSARRASRAFRA